MNLTAILFRSPDVFKVISVDNQTDQICIYVQTKQEKPACPNCCEPSTKLHSYYTRRFNDLPAFGKSCSIYLKTRKYRCLTDECPLKIFTERYEDHFDSYRRNTKRLEGKLFGTAIELGGRPAERICRQFSMPVNDTTLLRLIARAQLPHIDTFTAIGVDDWAYKKRERYGSILVDLTTRKIVDLLPDREEKTVVDWLRRQPNLEVVTRDRYGNYVRGATRGAPQAIQVTDRWHLLKNLGEALTRMMTREYSRLNRTLLPEIDESPIEIPVALPVKAPEAAIKGVLKRRFDEMKKLQTEGLSANKISAQLHMSRSTVRKYLQTDSLTRKSYGTERMTENHFDYIRKRLQEDPSLYLKTLWTELRSLGYNGGYSTLSEAMAYYGIRIGKKVREPGSPRQSGSFFKPSSTSMIFLKPESKLNAGEKHLLDKVCGISSELKQALSLTRTFRSIMENKNGDQLGTWIENVKSAGISEINTFANGLLKDYRSIENALTLPWSNGPVEGNVNKLKTIKRQMYGRASFDLLRKRLVLKPT
ncbi:MAG: ISL3 family transposase [Bacteroidota bacterium]